MKVGSLFEEMEIGDLVRNKASESKISGVIVDWSDHHESAPEMVAAIQSCYGLMEGVAGFYDIV